MYPPVTVPGPPVPALPLRDRPPIPPALGWVLLAPAAVLLLVSYVWPLIVALTKFGKPHLPPPDAGDFGNALSYAGIPLLIVIVAAPVLAFVASRAGRPARWVVRALIALPLAAFAPTGLAVLWIARHQVAQTEPLKVLFAHWDG